MGRWDSMPPHIWQRLQDRKLSRYLKHEVLPYHPYYRRKFGNLLANINSVEEFQRHKELITQKPDIVGHDKEFVLQPPAKAVELLRLMGRHDPVKLLALIARARGRPYLMRRILEMEYRDVRRTYTTGRSAARTCFVFTNHDLNGFLATAARRSFEMLDVPAGSYGISVFPVALHLAHLFVVEGARAVPCTVDPLIGLSSKDQSTTELRIEAIERLKPYVIFGVPQYMDRLLALAAEQKRDFSSIARVIVGGSGISQEQRERMKEALLKMGSKDPVVISSYGFTEGRMAFIECVEGAKLGMDVGYHLFPDLAIVETARITENEDGSIKTVLPCEPREKGDILFTPLEGHGSVVIRWRTKDLAALTYQPCPACHRSLPRLLPPIQRRSSDTIKKVKGTLIDFDDVGRWLSEDSEIRVWHMVIDQKNGQDLIFLCLALTEKADNELSTNRIRRKFKAETEVSIDELTVEPYETVIRRLGTDTELKEKQVLDLRSQT